MQKEEEETVWIAWLAPWSSVSVPQDGGLGDHAGDDVGVHVGGRPAVLEVAFALPLGVAPHADGRAAVRHALQHGIYTRE